MMTPMRYYPVPDSSSPAKAVTARTRGVAAPVENKPLDLGHFHLHIYVELQPATSAEIADRLRGASRQWS